ncbi:MAG: RtcB family protein [Acetobacteraceae bacterium]|nr:RtcB family protein [Acetobacteraceae bacterium]
MEGIDSPAARASLYSTIHGAGRLFGRRQVRRTFTRAQMDARLRERGVLLAGGIWTRARWPTGACPTCWPSTPAPSGCCTRSARSRLRWRGRGSSIRSRIEARAIPAR